MTEPGQEPGMPPDDRELEEFLARRSELSRLHREQAQEQAPPQLDARVLQAAREAQRRTRRPRRLLRWDNPLALAASALLVLGLGWLTQSHLTRPGEEAQAPAVAATPAAAAAPVPPPAAQPPPEQQAGQEAAAAVERSRNKRAAESPPRPATAAAQAVPSAPEAKAKNLPLPATPTPAEPPPPERPLVPAPAQDAAVPTMAPSQPAARDRVEEVDKSLPAPPPPAPTAFAAAAPQAAARAPSRGAGQAYSRAQAAPAAGLPDPCAAAQRAAAQRQAAPESRGDPAAWLARIRALRDAGSADAARAELACFAARNPQAALPDDLAALLPAAAP